MSLNVAVAGSLVLAGSLSLVSAWFFATVFELPFRCWADVRNAIRAPAPALAPSRPVRESVLLLDDKV
jgi:hypothetical protein